MLLNWMWNGVCVAHMHSAERQEFDKIFRRSHRKIPLNHLFIINNAKIWHRRHFVGLICSFFHDGTLYSWTLHRRYYENSLCCYQITRHTHFVCSVTVAICFCQAKSTLNYARVGFSSHSLIGIRSAPQSSVEFNIFSQFGGVNFHAKYRVQAFSEFILKSKRSSAWVAHVRAIQHNKCVSISYILIELILFNGVTEFQNWHRLGADNDDVNRRHSPICTDCSTPAGVQKLWNASVKSMRSESKLWIF